MTPAPQPVVFEPIYKPKPWGGRTLARLFGRTLPGTEPIGESWELSDLPGNESRVARGPLTGRTIGELVRMWGKALLGNAPLADGRFPLLIKFLDAREALSVQVHPCAADPQGRPPATIKHEAWYVIAAEPEAKLFIGLRPGVGPADVRRAAATPATAELLQPRPARPGRCFYLPAGVPHALGAGIVVAEVQTPSDVTYRLYDWDRVGLDGRPRELHIEQALANLRHDVPDSEIVQPRSHVADVFITVTRLVVCERFLIDKVRMSAGIARSLPHAEMVIWIVLAGGGRLTRDGEACEFGPGDVVLIPAEAEALRVETAADCEFLEVKIPIPSPLPARPRSGRAQ